MLPCSTVTAELRGDVWPTTGVCGAGVRPMKVLSENFLCRSLSSIHILYTHTSGQAPSLLPSQCSRLAMFHCPEVVYSGSELEIPHPSGPPERFPSSRRRAGVSAGVYKCMSANVTLKYFHVELYPTQVS